MWSPRPAKYGKPINELPFRAPNLELGRSAIPQNFSAALPDSVQVLPITPEIAVASTQLKNFHSDPADQLLVATAQCHRLTLLASDRLIRDGDWVKTIW